MDDDNDGENSIKSIFREQGVLDQSTQRKDALKKKK